MNNNNNNTQTTVSATTTAPQLSTETDFVAHHACPGCKTDLPFFKEIISEYHNSFIQCSCCNTSLKAVLTAGAELMLTQESIPGMSA